MEMQPYLNTIVDRFDSAMRDNVVGIYLHGSLAMGCFHPDKSDIDLLVVVKNKLSPEERKAVTRATFSLISEIPVGRGLEFSVVLEDVVANFAYPTPFEYHYSDFHRARYESDPEYFCGGSEDPDLAAHVTVVYHRGFALHGRPVRELFAPVDRSYYVQALLRDIGEASNEIADYPVYYSLNLCRVLQYLREGAVSSKKEGGEWGLRTLPDEYRPLLVYSLEEYGGSVGGFRPDRDRWIAFAEYMQREIGKENGTRLSN